MHKSQAKIRLEKLKKQLRETDYAYYVLDKPIMSDAARDSLKNEVEKIEKQFPALITADSPTQRIGGKALGKFKKVKHQIKKYSLDDVFSYEEVLEFDKRVKRFLKLKSDEDIEYTCELKIDGLNMSFHYKKGLFEKAVTRGDGILGEDVTHTVKTIRSLPLKLNKQIDLEIGGEVYLPLKSFEKLNLNLDKKFANPRNAAAGTIRQLDPNVASARDLDYFAWAVYNGQDLKTQEEMLVKMKELGFKVDQNFKKVKNIQGAIDYIESWQTKRKKIAYEIDGIAIKVNHLDWQKRLGRAAKYVRWACAYKFPAEQVTTIIKDVKWQVGRTGALTPVAILEPVQVAGSVVQHATLHNEDEIKRLKIKIGDTVIIQKAGDIIPDIIEVLPKLRTGQEKKIKIPEKCPVCSGNAYKREGEVALYCSSKNCFAQKKEELAHFVSRKGFNIDGFGVKIIEQLMAENLIDDFTDIFQLKVDELKPLERFAEKAAQNLIDSIEKSKKISLAKLIYSLGIRYVGEETAILLATNFKSKNLTEFLTKIKKANFEDLVLMEGIGDKVAQSIYDYFYDLKNTDLILKLEKLGVSLIQEKAVKKNEKIFNKTFVLTGALQEMSRDEAKDKIRKLGGQVSSSVSKKTDYLVVGDEPGSKFKKAQKLGVKIIKEKEFIDLF